jgi:chromosome segregation ATPase
MNTLRNLPYFEVARGWHRRAAEDDARMTASENEMEPQRLERVETSVNHLVSSVTALDTRVSVLDNKVTALDIKLTAVDARLTSVETSLTTVGTRLTRVESSLTAVDARLTRVESSLTAVDTRLTTVESSVTAVETRLTGLETKVDAQGRRFDTQMETLREDIKTFAENIGGRLDAISVQMMDKQKTTDARFSDHEAVMNNHDRRIAALERRPRRRS